MIPTLEEEEGEGEELGCADADSSKTLPEAPPPTSIVVSVFPVEALVEVEGEVEEVEEEGAVQCWMRYWMAF